MNLPHMTIAFMGEINSGKSTTTGQLLVSLGLVHPDVLEKLREQAAQISRADRYLSWISDSSRDSRERAMTVDRNYHTFQTNNLRFTIVDNPGHKVRTALLHVVVQVFGSVANFCWC
jgi:translation elongation factor EF-1alpha